MTRPIFQTDTKIYLNTLDGCFINEKLVMHDISEDFSNNMIEIINSRFDSLLLNYRILTMNIGRNSKDRKYHHIL